METGPHAAADFALSDDAQERVRRGTPAGTSDSYGRQWRAYARWCDSVGRVSLPATAATLTEYVTKLAQDGLVVSTIRQAIAAIRANHRAEGHPAPTTDGARLVVRDHARTSGRRPRKAAPVVVDALRSMVGTCDLTTLRGLRDRLVLVLGVAMMSRRSELAALDLDDVQEVPEGLTVLVRFSKTDKDAKGQTVAIPPGRHPETCPVSAVRAWRSALSAKGITSGRLLRSIDRHGNVGPSLTGWAINEIVKAKAAAAGITNAEAYTAHGLRAGGVTMALAAGAPQAAVTEHGRWVDSSAAVGGYHRAVEQWKHNPMRNAGL